jgi:hypothetical protein
VEQILTFFHRPKDNCDEIEELEDEDGDALGGACKTDGDHGLGFFSTISGFCGELIMPSIDGFIFSVRLLEIGCTRTSRNSTPRNKKNVSILLSMLACLKHLTRSAGLYNYLE